MIVDAVIRNAWYAAGYASELQPDQVSGQTIAGKPILIWRTRDGQVGAFDDRCPHKRMALSAGRIREDGTLECAYHGLRFGDHGQCVAVPSHPDGHVPPQAYLRPYPVIEQDGTIWVWPGDPVRARAVTPPRTPELVDARWHSIAGAPTTVKAHYLLLIENLLDITHFYPLHDGNIGDIENSRLPIEVEEGEVAGNRFVRTVRRAQNYIQPPFMVDWFGYPVVDRIHTHCMVSPGLTRVELRVAPPGQLGSEADRGYVLYHTHTPIDAESHVWRWRVNMLAHHRAAAAPGKSAAERFAETFPTVAEDLWALEQQQRMAAFPDDGYFEVYLRPDKAVRLARKVFRALERAEKDEPAEQRPAGPLAAE